MKILLTGASGMLGQALAKTFADSELTACGRAELDICNFDAIQKKLVELQPAIVMNAVAYTAVDAAETDELTAMRVNAAAVENLANCCKKINARLIHFSTDYVFDGANPDGYREEEAPTRPLSVYGASKLAGEIAIANSGCKHAIIRTSWLFGLGGKNFVETMLRLGAEKSELKIVADQIGCPTFCDDLAAATQELIEAGDTGIFHLVNSEPTSWADFAREIFRQSDLNCEVKNIPTSDYPTPAARPACSTLLNTRRPQFRSWQSALADYLAKRS